MAKKYSLDGGTKAFNTFLKGLLRLGVPAGNTVVITVPGRKTGQPRSTPITLQVEGGRRYAMAPYGEVAWVQNVRAAGGRARFKSRGRDEAVRLQEAPSAVAAPLLKKYRRLGGSSPTLTRNPEIQSSASLPKPTSIPSSRSCRRRVVYPSSACGGGQGGGASGAM